MMTFNPVKWLTAALFVLLLSIQPSGSALGKNSDSFSATLVDFSGNVTLQKPDESIWLPVEKNIPLEKGDRIRTEKNAFAEILMDDGSLVKLEENAEMTLEEISAEHDTKKIDSSLFLWFGRVLSNIVKFTHTRSRFNIRTPTMVAGVRGTEFVVEATDSKETEVGVFDGSVAVAGLGSDGRKIKESEVIIGKGFQTRVLKNKRPLPPFAHGKKMSAHRKRIERMRAKALDRRRNLKKIIEKRRKARDKILKKWKKVRPQKIKNPKTPRKAPKKGAPVAVKKSKNGFRKKPIRRR
ncbi:MAG: FecR domain-containing protein [Deltaproteobacteria bacterium]|nr:FecR domain-containing protein [Deltaproteobacteria bacterium]